MENSNWYFLSWFDRNNNGYAEGHMFHDMTYNIDGVDYTFDSDGICQNPPSQTSNSTNEVQEQTDNKSTDELKNEQENTNNEVDNEDTNNMPNISASIYGIISNDKNTSKFILPKEAYNLRRYFMGIY